MDDLLKATLLLNACRAPFSAWEALKDDPTQLWTCGEETWKKLGLRPSSCSALAALLDLRDWPERELERIAAKGAHFLTPDDLSYSPRLKDLRQPPVGLYVLGKPEALTRPSVAIVGTRRCTLYAKTVAEALGKAAAQAGFVVLSGGARGVDGAGHAGCLNGGGQTVAVLGTSLDRVYPAEHRELFARIAGSGALVSEYPFNTEGAAWRFPERNRLIAGMASRLVVVESPEDGGAMITARLALELGREIWSVPCRITEGVGKGSNILLRDGANPLIDIEDFIGKISSPYGQLLIDFGPPNPAPALSTDEKIVLSLLQRQGGRTVDELLAESGLDFPVLQTCLLELAAAHLIVPSGPGRYSALP
ncbi:MAG: DNA-protecting protein DprA [Fretibacterium sp.]|nr:DNA-protecting protein DprA [Fretibacterium sp.]